MPKNPHITKPTHTHTHTLQKKLKQPQYKIHPNEIDTIQSSILNMSPLCSWHLSPQELHRNSLHFKIKSLHTNHVISLHSWFVTNRLFKIINRKINKPDVTTSDNWMRSAHISVFAQNTWVLINGHYFIWQLCPLFAQTVWRDDRQCSARCCSALPWLDVHTFKFNVLKLILGCLLKIFQELSGMLSRGATGGALFNL